MLSRKPKARRSVIYCHFRYSFAVLCFLIISQGASIAAPQDMSPDDLQVIVNDYLSDKSGVLGTLVHIDIPGKEPVKAAYGHFDLTKHRPITVEDKFLIGSITKTFTATLVLQLVEAGSVELHGRLIDYLPPDWAAVLSQVRYGDEITVAHALSHRTGVYNVLSRETFIEYVLPDPSRKWAPVEILELIPTMGEPHFKPGESFRYSNLNYLLLAGLIEQVTGRAYSEALQDSILSRIGLEDTLHAEGPFGSNREDVAHGYQHIDGKLYDGQEFDSSWAIGAGAMISTTEDLITYMKALKSGRLFTHRKTFNRMIDGMEEEGIYGFGIEAVEDSQVGLYYGHRGTFTNTSAALRHFPKHGVTICTCQTFDGSARRLKTDELLQVVMGKLLGIEYIPRIPQHEWPKDILDYKTLKFSMGDIKTIEKYDCERKTITARSAHDKLIRVTLKGRSPRNGRFQFAPSRVRLAYRIGAERVTTPCLAVGMRYKTNEGAREVWVTSDEERKRISRTTINRNDQITIYALFELPKEGESIGVLFP